MKKFTKAFTLIELLIVIALLGALAVGLLAALDPFEQLKKGTDTGIRNTTVEFQGATIRFYAIKNHLPWCDPAVPATCNDPSAVTLDLLNAAGYYNAVDQVVNTGELKTDFLSLGAKQLDKIYVSGVSVPSPTAIACFLPTSKSFQNDPNTKFTSAGVAQAAGTCKSQGGATDCYWCIM